MIALSGIIGTVIGTAVGPALARISKVPGPLVVPFIFILSVAGPFLTDTHFFPVWEMLVFSVVGVVLRRLKYPLGSFVLGLVLGPTFEQNIYLTNNIYPGWEWIWERPLATAIFLIAIVVLVVKALEIRRAGQQRKRALAALGPLTPEARAGERSRRAPYPLLSLIVSVLLVAMAVYVVAFCLLNFDPQTGAMPLVGGLLVGVPALWLLRGDIVHYVQHRRDKPLLSEAGASDALVPEPAGDAAVPKVAPDGTVLAAAEPEPVAVVLSQAVGGASVERSWRKGGQYRLELVSLLWLVLGVVLCWLIGFLWGTLVFMLAYGLLETKRNLRTWRGRLVFTAASTAVMTLAVWGMLELTNVVYNPIIPL